MAAVALAQRHAGASPRGACTTFATFQGAPRDSKGLRAPPEVGFWRALPEPCCAATTFGWQKGVYPAGGQSRRPV